MLKCYVTSLAQSAEKEVRRTIFFPHAAIVHENLKEAGRNKRRRVYELSQPSTRARCIVWKSFLHLFFKTFKSCGSMAAYHNPVSHSSHRHAYNYTGSHPIEKFEVEKMTNKLLYKQLLPIIA